MLAIGRWRTRGSLDKEERAAGEVEALQKASAEAADPAGYVDDVMQPCLSALEASGL